MEKNGNHKAKRMKITNTLRNIRKIRKMQKETLLVQYFPVLITCFPSMVAFFLVFYLIVYVGDTVIFGFYYLSKV